MRNFGLIGKTLSHSFSKKYFEQKFAASAIENCSYHLFELAKIADFSSLLKEHDLYGLNVTIPYKQEIIPYLDRISLEAENIGAVNCIEFNSGKLIGHNTDVYGFTQSLKPLLKTDITDALILGSGGAAKAVAFGLTQLGINFKIISRQKNAGDYTYEMLSEDILGKHSLLINTTPLGTYPNVENAPNLPYHLLSSQHLLYDLVYNPEITTFLSRGKKQNCGIKNGYEMLVLQAEKSWAIWNSSISPKTS